MIGNDIVDLQVAAIESNWRRPGFLQKIFTTQEQKQIKEARDPDLLVWIFWSMKEAVYKAHQRKFGLTRNFNPSQIECDLRGQEKTSASGKVRIGQSIYTTRTVVKESYVHTTTTASAGTEIFSKIYSSSANIYEHIFAEISVKMGFPRAFFSIEKGRNAVPTLEFKGKRIHLPFSISHHGKYAAFSCR
jgi:phosphopantetheine--protein transferase-like protein